MISLRVIRMNHKDMGKVKIIEDLILSSYQIIWEYGL